MKHPLHPVDILPIKKDAEIAPNMLETLSTLYEIDFQVCGGDLFFLKDQGYSEKMDRDSISYRSSGFTKKKNPPIKK